MASTDDVTRLERRLRATIRDLRRSNRDLEAFAYAASHDLQTPLRKVKNFILLLDHEYGYLLEGHPEAQQYMKFAVEGAEKSQQLIDALLKFSRTGRTIELTAFAMDDVVDDALFILGEDIESKRVTIDRQTPLPMVVADRSLMVRVFQNLLGNAIKFRSEPRRPHIVIRFTEEPGDWTFEVSDNGVGIDKARYGDRVFTIFQRIGHKNGAGLGLALCKRIVERHGGKMWFESEVGVGTSFFFTLPKEPSTNGVHVDSPEPSG